MDREIGQNLFIEYKQGYEKLVPDSMTILTLVILAKMFICLFIPLESALIG